MSNVNLSEQEHNVSIAGHLLSFKMLDAATGNTRVLLDRNFLGHTQWQEIDQVEQKFRELFGMLS